MRLVKGSLGRFRFCEFRPRLRRLAFKPFRIAPRLFTPRGKIAVDIGVAQRVRYYPRDFRFGRAVGDFQYIRARNQFRISMRDDRSSQPTPERSEEHTSELQSLMRISYAVFCL